MSELAGHRAASEGIQLGCHLGRVLSLSEIDRGGMAAAQENPDVLAGSGLITTRNECCKGGSTSGLGNYPQCLPKSQLGTLDRVVRNQDYVVYMLIGDGVHERADATGCEGIRRYTTSRGVDRFSCPERHREG